MEIASTKLRKDSFRVRKGTNFLKSKDPAALIFVQARYKKEGRPVWLSLFFASSRALSYDVRQEDAEDQHREAT